MKKLALSFAALCLIVFVNFIYEKLSGPTRFVVTADTKIIPGSELSKYVTQEEIDDFAFRYWDIDMQIKDDAFAENFRKLLKSKQTDQILKFMQDNNISIDSPVIDGVTPLMYASFYDDEATAKRLIDMGANAHAQDNYKLSPLAYAIENNSTKTAKLLLDSGVKFDEVKAVQWYRKTPFYHHIEKLIIDGDDVEIVFRDNYQVNKESKDVNDPIGYIVTHNYVEMTELALASGYRPKLDDHPNTFFHGLRDDSEFMRSLYILLDTIPNYEPMLNLLLDNNVSGQPTKEELKKAYDECYKSYRWHIDNWKEEIDKNQTIPILIRMSIKNGERYCPDKDGAFSDTYTFIRWANEKKKLKIMISFWDTLKGDPTKVIYINSNRSKSNSNSNLQSK
ncbi:ankyrin repeat domain-containing protein [Campylobacter showae]|uniref:ankyrin repeat domain-containing protein n=1 Tax=Campylobacter showae TaxID=204 RepID=UPI000F07DDA5|nr:ankyrin repeat domain-containing protein [Campylobacter showae]